MSNKLENKFYKVKIDLTDEYRKRFNIPNDYEQYYFINFITQEGYCYLPDGTKATYYKYNRDTDITDESERHRKEQFTILSIAVISKYEKYFKAGQKYADKHNIPPAKWVQEINAETEEHIRQHELEDEENENNTDDEHNDYIILPTHVDNNLASVLKNTCDMAFMKYSMESMKKGQYMRWLMIDEGYIHDNIMTEYKNTWVYYYDEHYDSKTNDTIKLADITPLAMVAIGYLNDRLLITLRFIMIDNEMNTPNDVSMELPFNKPFNAYNPNFIDIIPIIQNKLPDLISLIDNTVNMKHE